LEKLSWAKLKLKPNLQGLLKMGKLKVLFVKNGFVVTSKEKTPFCWLKRAKQKGKKEVY